MIDGRAPVSEFALWSRTPIYLCGIGAEKNPAMIDGRAPTSFASQQGHLEVLHCGVKLGSNIFGFLDV